MNKTLSAFEQVKLQESFNKLREENRRLQEQFADIAPLGIIKCASCGKYTPIIDEGMDHICPCCANVGLREQLEASQEALRHVALHGIPAGGQERFNSEHLLDIAGGDTSALDAIRKENA